MGKGVLDVLETGIFHGIALIMGPSITSVNGLDIWHKLADQAIRKERVTESQE